MAAETVSDVVHERVVSAASAWCPGSSVTDLRTVPGGHSGITMRATVWRPGDDAVDVVVKMTPPDRPAIGRHDVLRQARVLRALEGIEGLLVPAVLLADEREPNLFAMEFVEGESAEPVLDGPNLAPSEVAKRARSAARMLAALHAAPLAAGPLADEPVLSVEDELARWRQTMDAVPERLRPKAAELHAELSGSIPSAGESVVLHGDYRLGNTLSWKGRVRAVIDWEIWSVGDRRVDLGWFRMFCDEANFPGASTPAPGMPSADELLREYEDAAGVTVADEEWFDAFASYKMAAIMGHNLRRHLEGRHHDPYQERLAPTILALVDRGLGIMKREAAPEPASPPNR